MRATIRRVFLVALGALSLLCMSAREGPGQEKKITVGLFAPAAPFGGPEERLAFVGRVADHLSARTGMKVTGRVYGRAGALTAAVKKGEVQFVIVDAPYAAGAGNPYQILATATRGGSGLVEWQLVVGADVASLADLRHKTVMVPSVGGRESAFVFNALFAGHVPSNWFEVAAAPDAVSAVAAVSVNRAQAAIVPAGLSLPAGTRRMIALTEVGWPMFAAVDGVDAATVKEIGAAIGSFRGDGVFTGFAGPGAGEYAKLERSFSVASRRGPLAVPPPAQFDAKGLLGDRSFAIPNSDVSGLVAAPPVK